MSLTSNFVFVIVQICGKMKRYRETVFYGALLLDH